MAFILFATTNTPQLNFSTFKICSDSYDIKHLKMKQLLLLSYIIISLVLTTTAQNNKSIPPEKPKLIISIVIEQMRYDYISRFWEKFEKNGFKRLISEGSFCKNTNLNYIFSQSSSGHASIFTGSTPSQHGIISNSWYLANKKKKIYCTDDEKYKTVGSESNTGKMSPKQLTTTTFGDELKLYNNNKSKIIGVSMKDYAAILPAGHTANTAYWYDNQTGNWITSSYYISSLPEWVIDFNKKKLPDFYLDRQWTPLLSITEYTESLPDSNIFETGINNKTAFPYNLNELSQIKKNARNYNLLKSTPFGNTITNDFAIAAIIGEQLGADKYTDVLTISYTSTGNIGDAFGTRSVEIEDTYLRLDKEIAHLIDYVNDNFGKENVLIFLTADNGTIDNPKYLAGYAAPAGFFNHVYAVALLKSYLNALYGEGDWISEYIDQQLYLNQKLIEDSKLSLSEVQNKAAQFLLQFSGVANTITATTLQNTNFTEGIFDKMQNSYNQKRSGDVLINLEPGWIQETYLSTAHNSAYSYDSHIPLIWYGWKIGRKTINRKISITDIAPTISWLLNIPFTSNIDGDPIIELSE